jgi:glutamate racemase
MNEVATLLVVRAPGGVLVPCHMLHTIERERSKVAERSTCADLQLIDRTSFCFNLNSWCRLVIILLELLILACPHFHLLLQIIQPHVPGNLR